MPNYKRIFVPGGTYFFTLVTFERAPLFNDPLARSCLREAFSRIKREQPFEQSAICLLPEHLHCVWRLPYGDADYPRRWSAIKGLFSKSYLRSGGTQGAKTRSRNRRGEAALWQRRIWEHFVRDEGDLARHLDYLHYNPVKHGLTDRVADWPWSSYHRYLEKGVYTTDWGQVEPACVQDLAPRLE